ncbi:Ig-like domain-containing protein [Lachnospiraceae bacterium ZAX-1]
MTPGDINWTGIGNGVSVSSATFSEIPSKFPYTVTATVTVAVAPGTAAGNRTLTATIDGNSANVVIHITAATVPVASVSLAPNPVNLKLGETTTQQLTATVAPANATNKAVTWASSNKAVADVSTSGLVTAKAVGTATITATAGGKSGTATINVAAADIRLTKITLSKTKLTIVKGKSATLTATFTPANAIAADKVLKYTSSDTKIATVEDGKVTGKNAGIATITVKSGNGKSATATVTVADVTLNSKAVTLQVKKTTTDLKVDTIFPAKDSVKWKSSNTKVVTVSSKGKLTAGSKTGTATITATTASGAIATAKVTVQAKPVVVKKLNVTKTLLLVKGKSETLTATKDPLGAPGTIKYSTSNKKVATVDKNGKVKAIAAGTATITAAVEVGSKTIKATTKVTVAGITLKATKANVKVNKIVTITVKSTVPKNDNITYTSSDKKIATVDSRGKVKGVKAGKATITVTTKSGATAKFTVTVKN